MINTKIKQFLIPMIGFGLGGFLWAWAISIETSPYIANPFGYVIGAFYIGVLGSLALVLGSKDIKKILLTVVLGTLGWVIAWFLPLAIDYYLYLFGAHILDLTLGFIFSVDVFANIGFYWLEFFATGAIVGLAYALILKKKKWSMMWKIGLGFAISSFIGPLFSNIFISFTIIGIILGLTISWAIKKS